MQAALQVDPEIPASKSSKVALPDFPYGALVDVGIGAESASVFEPLITSGKVNDLADPSQAAGLRASLDIPARDYLRAMRIRSLVNRKFRDLFADVDALVSPCPIQCRAEGG